MRQIILTTILLFFTKILLGQTNEYVGKHDRLIDIEPNYGVFERQKFEKDKVTYMEFDTRLVKYTYENELNHTQFYIFILAMDSNSIINNDSTMLYMKKLSVRINNNLMMINGEGSQDVVISNELGPILIFKNTIHPESLVFNYESLHFYIEENILDSIDTN